LKDDNDGSSPLPVPQTSQLGSAFITTDVLKLIGDKLGLPAGGVRVKHGLHHRGWPVLSFYSSCDEPYLQMDEDDVQEVLQELETPDANPCGGQEVSTPGRRDPGLTDAVNPPYDLPFNCLISYHNFIHHIVLTTFVRFNACIKFHSTRRPSIPCRGQVMF
jgi:hypothetical protein